MSSVKLMSGESRIETAVTSEAASGSSALTLVILVVAIVVLRLPTIDFSSINYDESVYTLLGSGIKSGLMPYVDLVDRKPIGIFLIYGFADLLFHDTVVGPRILAALATLIGSALLVAIGRRFLQSGAGAAVAGGVLFASYAVLFGGDAAQAPVFFTPLVIGATLIVAANLRRLVTQGTPDAIGLGAAGLLLGLALQIKYSMVFEAIAFGGMLIFAGWVKRAELSPQARRALVVGCGLMIVGGVVPTLAVGAVYAAQGHFDAWFFYNFVVNLEREGSDYSRRAIAMRIAQFTLSILPLCIPAAVYVHTRWVRSLTPRLWNERAWFHALAFAWLLSALVAGLMLRQPYSHYFYDVLAPLSLYAGAGLQRPTATGLRQSAVFAAISLVAFTGFAYAIGWRHEINKNGSPFLAYKIAELLRSENPKSLYVFNHMGVLYRLTGQPLPTRYPLPSHLWRALEGHSFQFDQQAELDHVLAQHPEMIVVSRPLGGLVAKPQAAQLDRALNDGYCTWRAYGAGEHTIFVYRYEPNAGAASMRDACDD